MILIARRWVVKHATYSCHLLAILKRLRGIDVLRVCNNLTNLGLLDAIQKASALYGPCLTLLDVSLLALYALLSVSFILLVQ